THILGAFAQFERDIMAERVRSGIANAKAKGKIVGRKPKQVIDVGKVLGFHNEGLSERKIGKMLNLPASTVYSVVKKYESQSGLPVK
ncbi:MAG: recombinase family protein, partial [Nitrospirae bacterium]|nr:recombinase family protein [Nitrospirota bacterium]